LSAGECGVIQIAEFSKTYQVVAPDLPAHGDSPEAIGPYTTACLANAIIDLLDFLKVERTHVCGHSLGGMVAQQLAASRPERVARLVLAETAFSTQSSRGNVYKPGWRSRL